MPNMVPFQASWLKLYRVMHVTVISPFRSHMVLTTATVVPQIFNFVLMNIIISTHL